ncbi:BppU family phage baseplate upper protein [Lactococcus lactis]|uniref:BppU family phage baseplate upper protein n=1 Tax=Lactococcus lactis TaxID=1358 RepID=UPI0018AA0730|nr:BppU family phage baseplate upper protein [Lactococcus lactis]
MSLDNFKKQTITWDMINQAFEQPIQIMEGDVNARTLLLKITDNGSVLDLTGYSVKLTYKYVYKSQSGFIMLTPNDISKGEFTLIIPTEMTVSGLIKSNLILLNESLEQVIVSKNLTFISDNSTVTDLAQEVNNKIDDFTKLLLENMPQVMRSELNDLHAKTESNTSNIELKANLADMTSLQNAMTNLQNEVEAFGITPENLVTIKSLLDAIASNASESQVVELINSVNVLTSNISLMSNGDYSPKANQTDLESLQSAVNNQSATISTKANQTDLNNLQTTVNNQGIAISKKAEQSDLLITNQNVTTAQATANQAETDAQTAITNASAAQANSLPLNGNAVSASKLATSRKLGVSLQASAYQNFDGTSDTTGIGVSGVLPIANGGTSTSDGVINTIAYANSADGTDGFTTVYPNLNLLKNTKSQSYTSTGTETNNSSNTYPLNGVIDNILNKPLTITYNYAITNSSGTWSGTIRPTYGLGGTNQSVSNINLSGTHKEIATFTAVSQSSYGIVTSGLPSGTTVTITNLKVEFGSTSTPYMQSASEVTISDYPKYVGFSNIIKPNKTSSDYKWLPMGLVSIDSATGLLKPATIGVDYAQAHPVGSVVTNSSNSSSGYTTGTWQNIGSAVIGSTTIYYWKRTA